MPREAPDPDDIALLLAVARKDESAFAEFYHRFSPRIFSLVVRIVRSQSEAEEILQETFWQIWESAPSYQSALGSPFSWVITIARRKAIDRLRSNSRHLQRIAEVQAAVELIDVAALEVVAGIAAEDRPAVVRAAFAQINEKERRAIELAFFDGLTHPEIAEALKEPVGTIKARIRRGLLKLEEILTRQSKQGGHP